MFVKISLSLTRTVTFLRKRSAIEYIVRVARYMFEAPHTNLSLTCLIHELPPESGWAQSKAMETDTMPQSKSDQPSAGGVRK